MLHVIADIVLVLLAAGGLGATAYLLFSARAQRKERREELSHRLAIAQINAVQQTLVVGPSFPRAYMHIGKIAARVQEVRRLVDEAHWADVYRKQQCIDDLDDLQRHCEGLAHALAPKK